MGCDGNRRDVGGMSGGVCSGVSSGAAFSPILFLLCITIYARSAIKGYTQHTKSGILSRFLCEESLFSKVIGIVAVTSLFGLFFGGRFAFLS